MWEPRRLTALRNFTACYKASFTIFLLFYEQLSLTLCNEYHENITTVQKGGSLSYQNNRLRIYVRLFSHLIS
jgi:hypothetical protein